MQTAHTYTGKAVVVSNKTISTVEGIVKRMVGGAQTAYDKGKARAQPPPNGAYGGGLTPAYGSPSGTPRGGSPQPPSYRPTPGKLSMADTQYPSSQNLNSSPTDPSPKGYLPPYATRTAPPVPARKDERLSPQPSPSPNVDKLNTKDRIVLSANLILGTIGKSTKQVVDVGSDRLSAVVGHKSVFSFTSIPGHTQAPT